MRISPVNISVHTVNPALRAELMGNPKAGEALAHIPRLAKAGIALNAQLVLCPGRNDGAELERSVQWLAQFHPAMQSIAAVPVGLTRHRAGLTQLAPYTRESAAAQLALMLRLGGQCLQTLGTRLIYPADEWFLLAGQPLPEAPFYEDFPQLENGVGMWRLFCDEFLAALAETQAPAPGAAPRPVHIATGTLAAPLLQHLAKATMGRYPWLTIEVHAIENRFFGRHITVSGLLTGQDIVAALRGRVGGGRLLLPANLLRREQDLLLDGQSPAQLAEALGAEVCPVPTEGAALLAQLLQT